MKQRLCIAFLFLVLFSGITTVHANIVSDSSWRVRINDVTEESHINVSIEDIETPFVLTRGFSTIINIIVRIIVTISIEVGILLLFGIRTFKAVRVVAAANAITTFLIGGVLVCIFETSGIWAFYFMAIILEVTVVIIELAIYSVRLKEIPFIKILTYTIVANLITFIMGLRFITII